MTDTNQLPPLPTLRPGDSHMESLIEAAIQGHASTRDAMRWLVRQLVPALQARTQVQGDPSWWRRETDEGAEWTDTAPLVLSGWTPLYTTPQPAQATQADVTDEQINAVALEQWGPHAGGPLAAHRAFARAILALRTERVPMTDEQISLEAHNADDRDWNDLRFRSSWHEGFLEGARFAESHHGITAQTKQSCHVIGVIHEESA